VNELGKTMKVMAGITSTAFILSITGCSGSSQNQMTDKEWKSYTDSNQSSSSGYSNSSTDTSTTYDNEGIPPQPNDQNCSQWSWDQGDGVWECQDGGSSYYGHYYHGGRYYRSKPELYKSSEYNNYKNSSSFKGGGSTVSNSSGTSTTSSAGSDGSDGSAVKGSTGFGSGSKSFGG
jgi:hypothetical protein